MKEHMTLINDTEDQQDATAAATDVAHGLTGYNEPYNPNSEMLIFSNIIVNRHLVRYIRRTSGGFAELLLHEGGAFLTTDRWEDVVRKFQ